MTKLYRVEKSQGVFNVLDPDDDVIFTDKSQADIGFLVMLLNNRSNDNYEVSYSHDKHDHIISSTIMVGADAVLVFSEASVTDEKETRGYGILTHLNRKHFSF